MSNKNKIVILGRTMRNKGVNVTNSDLSKIISAYEEQMKDQILLGKEVTITGICKISSKIKTFGVGNLFRVDKDQSNLVRYTLKANFFPGIKKEMNERLKQSLKK